MKNLLAIFILLPIYTCAVYFIFKDDGYFLTRHIKRKVTNYKDPINLKRIYLVIGGFLSIAFLIILNDGSKQSLIVPLITLGIYLYWEYLEPGRKLRVLEEQSYLEFPSFIEVLSILISAGEAPASALKLITDRTHGALNLEFTKVIKEVEGGNTLATALNNLALRTNLEPIRRFCDTLILALERGSALSEVLAFQVQEVRNEHQSKLLVQSGKAEIALMIPVIFLILPVSILFALWPSYLALGRNFLG